MSLCFGGGNIILIISTYYDMHIKLPWHAMACHRQMFHSRLPTFSIVFSDPWPANSTKYPSCTSLTVSDRYPEIRWRLFTSGIIPLNPPSVPGNRPEYQHGRHGMGRNRPCLYPGDGINASPGNYTWPQVTNPRVFMSKQYRLPVHFLPNSTDYAPPKLLTTAFPVMWFQGVFWEPLRGWSLE